MPTLHCTHCANGHQDECDECRGKHEHDVPACPCGSERLRLDRHYWSGWEVSCRDCSESGEPRIMTEVRGESSPLRAVMRWRSDVEEYEAPAERGAA